MRSMSGKKKRGPRRTSTIWKMPENQFRQLVLSSRSVGEVLKAFGMKNEGRSHCTVRDRMSELGMTADHFDKGYISPPRESRLRPIEEFLVENSTASRQNVKIRLIKSGLIENKCQLCGSLPVWMDKPLTMVLDHINGESRDYRLPNLRFLCPNCNSQTSTFAGRNKKQPPKPVCRECGKPCARNVRWHQACFGKSRIGTRVRTAWPTIESLVSEVESSSHVAVAKRLGVSECAIRKKLSRAGVRWDRNPSTIVYEMARLTNSSTSHVGTAKEVVSVLTKSGAPMTRKEILSVVRVRIDSLYAALSELLTEGVVIRRKIRRILPSGSGDAT